MIQCLVHVQPLELRLFAAGHDVDVVAAAQTVVEDTQQTITVGRIIDANRFAPSRQGVIDKACGLVTETVVVVAPGMACQ